MYSQGATNGTYGSSEKPNQPDKNEVVHGCFCCDKGKILIFQFGYQNKCQIE